MLVALLELLGEVCGESFSNWEHSIFSLPT